MKDNRKLSIITDTGYVSDQMKGIIKESDCLVFESNHDVDMLRMGRYPWVTKQRILSDVGHVSNEDAAHAMRDVITDRTKRIYLSHLSTDNNIKELAKMSVEQVLNQYDIDTSVKMSKYKILSKIKDNQHVITLEIKGKAFTSEGLADEYQKWMNTGRSDVVFIIGGSNGLGGTVRKRSDQAISFGALTYPHQMMKVMLLEQIFRVNKILYVSSHQINLYKRKPESQLLMFFCEF